MAPSQWGERGPGPLHAGDQAQANRGGQPREEGGPYPRRIGPNERDIDKSDRGLVPEGGGGPTDDGGDGADGKDETGGGEALLRRQRHPSTSPDDQDGALGGFFGSQTPDRLEARLRTAEVEGISQGSGAAARAIPGASTVGTDGDPYLAKLIEAISGNASAAVFTAMDEKTAAAAAEALRAGVAFADLPQAQRTALMRAANADGSSTGRILVAQARAAVLKVCPWSEAAAVKRILALNVNAGDIESTMRKAAGRVQGDERDTLAIQSEVNALEAIDQGAGTSYFTKAKDFLPVVAARLAKTDQRLVKTHGDKIATIFTDFILRLVEKANQMATGRDDYFEVEEIYPGDELDRATEKDLMRLVASLQSEELASGARAATTGKAPAGGAARGGAKESKEASGFCWPASGCSKKDCKLVHKDKDELDCPFLKAWGNSCNFKH